MWLYPNFVPNFYLVQLSWATDALLPMALMVGAMTIHGIIPGPQVISKRPDLFWGMTLAAPASFSRRAVMGSSVV